MALIRRSNRAHKPRDYWDPTNSPPHQRHPPAFTIYTESSEHLPEHLPEGLPEGLLEGPEDLSEDLSTELSDNDLSTGFSDEDLSFELFDEDLSPELDEALSEDEALSKDEDLSEHLSRQLHEDLDVDSPYQPQFLPKDRAGKPQNLPEDSNSLKLFQLFFPVKEIENIVKQTNLRASFIVFKDSWKPLTVTEIYHYLGCLIYIEIQSL